MSGNETWIPAMNIGDISEEGMHSVKVGPIDMILMNVGGMVVAYRDSCPHEGFSLSKHGERSGDVIICNKHLWEFEAWSGEHISRIKRPGCDLTSYPTREINGVIEVEMTGLI
jgi:nitrite reductase/ring-hydroxylating ferredoxin subunit